MSRERQTGAARYSFNRWERWVYAARYPNEVPLMNGELEWIALSLRRRKEIEMGKLRMRQPSLGTVLAFIKEYFPPGSDEPAPLP